jgi:hypothetical protein
LRRSHVFLLFLVLCTGVISGLVIFSYTRISEFRLSSRDLGEITHALRLTDISFSHDARYTRTPSQADLFSAFQDYPGSIEHFPSGSVAPPPDFGPLGKPLSVKQQFQQRASGNRR